VTGTDQSRPPIVGFKNTGCFKKSFTSLKAYYIYSEDMYSVLNCHNVAKHTEFFLGQLRFNATSTGNAVFQKELYIFESLYIFNSEDIYSVLNCHNVAKHTEFYLE
jgi:hypothetical protein